MRRDTSSPSQTLPPRRAGDFLLSCRLMLA
jgi:hypothetical protein